MDENNMKQPRPDSSKYSTSSSTSLNQNRRTSTQGQATAGKNTTRTTDGQARRSSVRTTSANSKTIRRNAARRAVVAEEADIAGKRNVASRGGVKPMDGRKRPSNGATDSRKHPSNGVAASRKRPSHGATDSRKRLSDGEPGSRTKPANGVADSRKRPNNNASGRRKRPGESTAGRRSAKPVKKRRGPGKGLVIFILFVMIIGAIAAAVYIKKYSPSKTKADLNEYYGITAEGQAGITVDNKVVGATGMISDGIAYIDYDTVRDYINSRFYWDSNENLLLYTLANSTVRVEVGSKDYTNGSEKSSEDYVILKTEGQTAYIAAEFVQKHTNIEFNVYKNPNRIMVVGDWGKTKVATIKRDTQVRLRGGVKSPVLSNVKKGDSVTVVENEGNWKKVRTKDGYIGYVKKSSLKNEKEEEISRDFEEETYSNISKDYTINMAWHQVTNSAANSKVLETIASTKGLTTIAPTWFFINNTDGDISSLASSEYVNYAHQSNIEVWAVLNDFDGGISSQDETYEVLSHTSKREKVISQVLAAALQSGVDGINVDIERVSTECGEHYIQFIRELSVKCRQNNLVLSVDNYPPKSYNKHYNHKEQGIVADYVIIMGYDEHFSGSLEAGSVASISYVEEGINEMLKTVPAEKVINAMPFYTRLWKSTPKTQEELDAQAGTEEADYPNKVSSETYNMKDAVQVVSDAGATAAWDDKTQQNYATWEKDGTTYQIWLEDDASIEAKLKVMKENKLAGTSAWKLGWEDQTVWDVILKYVN